MIAVVVALVASSANAGAKFAVYEGRDAVREGNGGTKVQKDGIDFWTTGDPPRKYQVIGILTDKRNECLLCNNAVGSASVAKTVKAAGGDAVLVMDQNSQVRGAIYNYGVVSQIRKATTQLLVVKYLEPPAAP